MCHFNKDRIEISEFEREAVEEEPDEAEPEQPAVLADGGDEE